MSTKTTGTLLGLDLSATTSSPQFDSGTQVTLDDGGAALYVYANSAIAQFNFVSCKVSGASALRKYKAENLVTTRGPSKRVGVAQVAIAAGEYGWVHTRGAGIRGKAAVGCQPDVLLYTTATEGVVDDATVSAGFIGGLIATTSATSASAPTMLAGVDLFVGYH